MAKRKESKIEQSTYRLMIEQFPYKHISIDFLDKDEALQHAHQLTNKDTAWYGLYEINPKADFLILVEHNRLRPHDNSIPKISKDNTTQTPGRRRHK